MGVPSPARFFRFGAFQLDMRARELRRNGVKVRVPDQSIQVLAMLLEHPGDVVTREELHHRLWPNGTIVEFDHSINAAIKRLRQALEDSAEAPRFIETLPRLGYRFIGTVEHGPAPEAAAVPSDEPEPSRDELEGGIISHYRIQDKLGSGGMGVVYRAKDTRLGRTVALKFLPEEFSDDKASLERFQREARAASALNHPNICTLHDIGSQDGIDFLVMEYLEGETLAQRLNKGPLSLSQVLRYAIEIASALDQAHRHGVIHRDLKPGNIMLTKSGSKLLDFGLAKMHVPAAEPGTRTMTEEGTILGTLQYMAPEQLEAKEADARTDIFAFGAVLYEMATGKKAFEGGSRASLMAAILNSDPPHMSNTQSLMPPALKHVVRVCLAKDPDARWQTAHDVMLQLRWISAEGSQTSGLVPPVRRGKNRERLAWTLLTLTALAGLALAVVHLRKAPPEARPVRFSISPPDKSSFTGAVSISPDGRRLAMIVSTGKSDLLWVRHLDSMIAQPLPGTEGANDPFWSPDSRFIGFFAKGKLKRIEAGGGPVQILCDAPPHETGGAWNREGVIIFGQHQVLYRVPEEGGPATVVTALHKDQIQAEPSFLPDGRHFLYTTIWGERRKSGIYVGSLDSKETKRIVDSLWMAVYSPGFDGGEGHLLFIRDGILMAQPFDANRLQFSGQPVPVTDGLATYGGAAWPFISVSENGVLVYSSVSGPLNERTLVWVDRQGRAQPLPAPARPYRFLQLSPDGRLLALQITDAFFSSDVWTYDLARDLLTRVTYDGMSDFSHIVWAPDSKRLVFSSRRDGPMNFYVQDTDGSRPAERLLASPDFQVASAWTHDGRTLLFINRAAPTYNGEIWALPFEGERKPQPLRRGPSDQSLARLSPDGRWLAFVSDEGGREEVYVTSFPSVRGRWQISSEGGGEVTWAPNGRELFWRSGDKMMAAEIVTKAGFIPAKPRLLFSGYAEDLPNAPAYDVAPDGQRFVMMKNVDASVTQLNVVVNWPEYVRSRSGAGSKR